MQKGLGFNPNSKGENFGSGMACGLLIAVDLPLSLIAFVWNKFNKKIEFRSLGLTSIEDVLKSDNKNIGFYLGTLLFGHGVINWIQPHIYLLILSAVTFIIGIYATIKVNKNTGITNGATTSE